MHFAKILLISFMLATTLGSTQTEGAAKTSVVLTPEYCMSELKKIGIYKGKKTKDQNTQYVLNPVRDGVQFTKGELKYIISPESAQEIFETLQKRYSNGVSDGLKVKPAGEHRTEDRIVLEFVSEQVGKTEDPESKKAVRTYVYDIIDTDLKYLDYLSSATNYTLLLQKSSLSEAEIQNDESKKYKYFTCYYLPPEDLQTRVKRIASLKPQPKIPVTAKIDEVAAFEIVKTMIAMRRDEISLNVYGMDNEEKHYTVELYITKDIKNRQLIIRVKNISPIKEDQLSVT